MRETFKNTGKNTGAPQGAVVGQKLRPSTPLRPWHCPTAALLYTLYDDARIGAVSVALLLVMRVYHKDKSMAKKSESSRRGKLISVSAESIFSKPLNKRQKAALARIAKRQAAGQDSDIDL